MKIRFLSLILALTMLAGYAGVARAEAAPVELECFLIKVEALDVEEQIAAKFKEEYPNVTIRFVATPDAETALFARIAANDVPDIMNTYPAEVVYRKMMDDGLFVDLTGNDMFKTVPESTQKLSAYNGKQYALPLAMSSYGVFYNKDIFAKYGLTPSTDYKGFLDLCQKLKDAGEQPLEFYDKSAGGVGQMAERLTGILNSDSNALFQKVASGETDLTKEPEIRTLAETLLKIREFGQKDQLGTDLDQVVADFIAGRTAMFIGGTWNVATILKANKDLNFAMFQFPNPMGTGESLPVNIDTSYSVYTGAKDVDAAVAFVAFHARPEIAQMYADKEGSPNVIQGVTYNIEQLKPINDVIQKGEMFLTPVNFWPAGMRSNWEQYLQQLFIDKDVDAFVKATQDMVMEFYNS